jgi:hypothetical protein
MKIKLKTGVPDIDGDVFSKDCKITMPNGDVITPCENGDLILYVDGNLGLTETKNYPQHNIQFER